VRGLVFVVGYDRDIVSDLILQKKGYTEAIKGRDYLEKIIQITYRIPRAGSDKVIELTNACLAESSTGDLFDEAEVALVAEQNARNPRRIKRFLNGFVLTYGLDPQWREFKPGTLIRAQLLYMHFKSFADLLYRPYERDPVDEFVEYDGARDVLRRRAVDPDAWKRVERAFESHKLPPPGGPQDADFDAVLRRLEEYVPLPFPSLAAQDGFGSLLESLGDAEDWPRLRARLAAGAPPTVVPESIVETGEPEPKLPEARLEGLRVLWVDDAPERIRPQVERVANLGASVRLAANGAEAGERLDRDAFDVLVSDITRGGDPEAGLKDLRRFRAEGVTVPPAVVFFTSRITPARQSVAAELGATIVATTQELLERLADQVRLKTAQTRADEPEVRVYYHPADDEAERVAGEIDRRLPLFRVKALPGSSESDDGFGQSVVLVVGPAWTSDAEKAPVPGRIDVLALVGGAAKPPSSRLEATPGRVVSVRPDKWDEDLEQLAQLARNAIW
jgi:CheY-like chemotaxis protein